MNPPTYVVKETEKPSPGRIVHYVLQEGSKSPLQHRAAIVTSDFKTLVVNLTVYADSHGDLYPGEWIEQFRALGVTYDETGQRPNSWHWPERA